MPPDLYTEFLDLPPGPRPPNHYAILFLPLFEPDPKVIHDAALSQNAKLRRWALHPDKDTRDRVQDMLNELGMADFILGDPKTKAEYDRKLAAELGVPLPAAPRPTPKAAPPARRCPECGAATPPKSNFCPTCGQALREKEEPEESPIEGEEHQPAAAWLRRVPHVAVVAGLTAAAALILGIVVFAGLRKLVAPPPADPRLAEARKVWEAALAEAAAACPEKYAPAEWSAAKQKAEEAEARAKAGATEEALGLFRDATDALGKAKSTAQARADAEAQAAASQARFDQAIAAAWAALAKQNHEAAAKEVEAARRARPDAAVPRGLLAAIEPSLTVIADLDGTEFKGALVSLNGTLLSQSTPATFPLKKGNAYQIEVTIPEQGGRRLTQAGKTLTADWHGPRTFRAALSELPRLRPPVYQDWPFDAAAAKRRQEGTAWALRSKTEEDIDLGGGVKLTLVLIPAGEFVIGSPPTEAGRSDTEAQKRVTIDRPFWIGKHEVTQEQWEAVMGDNPSRFQAAKHPVEGVSWNDVQGFLAKLNARPGGGGFALPTEAQWEYACRAGTPTRFCSGDDNQTLDDYAWYSGNSGKEAYPVGGKKANGWGLHDVHGNAWEWCASPYAERYDGSEQRGAETAGLRVLRGGSSINYPWRCRSAYRDKDEPGTQSHYYGFRVARSTGAIPKVLQPPPPTDAAGPIVARVEKAISGKDIAGADAGVAELKKADPKQARLPDLEAKIEALRPKPPPAFQVYKEWPFGPAEAKRRQEETTRALGLKVEEDVDLGGGIKLTLVLIPAGRFVIGSPLTEAGRIAAEDPWQVTIARPFWIGKHEVTQDQWEAVTGSNPSQFKETKNPVERVSWNGIQGFLAKLNARVAGGGFALSTEAQWEYACRAGTATTFCSGDDSQTLGDYAWYSANSGKGTHPVGGKKANGWGLHDMHGNVSEWCGSPYRERYYGSEQKGAEEDADWRVFRGGSWYSGPESCRSAARDGTSPGSRYEHIGFRVVRSARTF